MDQAWSEPIGAEPIAGGNRSTVVTHVGNDVVFSEGDEQAMYILADLGEGCNEHLLKPGAKYTIMGLDSDTPELWLDGVKFEGGHQDFIGTLLMMSGQKQQEEQPQEQAQQNSEEHQRNEGDVDPDKRVKMKYTYKCHTQSRIRFQKKTSATSAAPGDGSERGDLKEGERHKVIDLDHAGGKGQYLSETGNLGAGTFGGSADEGMMEIDKPSDPRVDAKQE